MEECFQIPELLQQRVTLKEKGLTAERVAFSLMKCHVQPLMQREHLGFQYTSLDDASRISAEKISDDEVMERLQRIFKNIDRVLKAAVKEYIVDRPPNPVSSRSWNFPEYLLQVVCL